MSSKESIDDIYRYIVAADKKDEKKKTKTTNSFNSEIEHFKMVLIGDTISARSVVKIKPPLSQEWIKML
jgi:hypothetical protein